MNEQVEKLAIELQDKYSGPTRLPGPGLSFREVTYWGKLAKYVLRSQIDARISAIKLSKDPTEGKDIDPWTAIDDKITELEKQLQSLKD